MNPHQIVAPNYTQIPNILIDHWMKILTPAEMLVALCICRKTFGWGKSSDLISLKQIHEMTGLHKSGIVKNVESLIAHGLVHKIKSKTSDGDDAPNRYSINVISLGGVDSVGGGSLLSRQQVVDSVDKGVVYSVDTQKKAYTKENITKEQHPPTPKGGASSFSLNSKEKKLFGEFVLLTQEEHAKLLADYGTEKLAELLDILNAYIGSSGKRYKSHWHALLPSGWVNTAHLQRKSTPSLAAADKVKVVQERDQIIIKNRKIAQDAEKHFRVMPNRPDIRIFADIEYIQIGEDKIEYAILNFKDRLIHSLRKHKFQE